MAPNGLKKAQSRRRGGKWLQMDAHKTDENTNPLTRGNGSGAWGKWLQKGYKKTEPPARVKTGVTSKVKTIWRWSTFFSKSLRTRVGSALGRGDRERAREGSGAITKKTDGFARV